MNSSKKRAQSVLSLGRNFGYSFMLQCLVRRLISFKCYDAYMYRYLTKYFQPVIKQFANNSLPRRFDENVIHIWTLWWQGEEQAPEIVRKCLESQKLLFGGRQFRYHVLSQENWKEYVDLPEYIITKVGNEITLTHFSDIIRAELIRKYGGLWIDATVYCCRGQLTDDIERFFTVKVKPQSEFYTRGRWSGFLIGDVPGSVLFNFMAECFRYYWKNEKTLIAYLLIDYVIAIAYDQFPEVKKEIDNIVPSNRHMWSLLYRMNHAFENNLWQQIVCDNTFLKLSYKAEQNGGVLKEYTDTGKLTFWGHIKENTTIDTKLKIDSNKKDV